MVIDSFACLAQGGVAKAQVAKVCSFVPAVTDFAGNSQCMLVVFDGLASLAQSEVG